MSRPPPPPPLSNLNDLFGSDSESDGMCGSSPAAPQRGLKRSTATGAPVKQHTPKRRKTQTKLAASSGPDASVILLHPIDQVTDKMERFGARSMQSASTASLERAAERERRATAARQHGQQSAGTVLPHLQFAESIPLSETKDPLIVHDMASLAQIFPDIKANGEGIRKNHDREHVHDPITLLMKRHIDNLTRPVSSESSMSPTELGAMLRKRLRVLPAATAGMETWLLQEAGTFPQPPPLQGLRHYPACCKGPECVGRMYKIDGGPIGGFTLTSFMYQEEIEIFSRTGTAPTEPRPCVLCMRAHVTSFILDLRPNYRRVTDVDGGFVCHALRNLCDVEDGYNRADIIYPSRKRWEGLVDTVVGLNISKLVARRDPSQNNRWFVDQSAIVWQPPMLPRPRVAESVQDFLRRVVQTLQHGETPSPGQTARMAQQWRLLLLRQIACEWEKVSPPVLEPRALHSLTAPSSLFSSHGSRGPKTRSAAKLRADRARIQLIGATDTTHRAYDLNDIVCITDFLDAFYLHKLRNSRTEGEDAELVLLNHAKYYSFTYHDPSINHVHECCFWFDDRSIKRKLIHVLNKTIPQPSQTRVVGSFMCSTFGIAPAVRAKFLALCSEAWPKCKRETKARRRTPAQRTRKRRRTDDSDGLAASQLVTHDELKHALGVMLPWYDGHKTTSHAKDADAQITRQWLLIGLMGLLPRSRHRLDALQCLALVQYMNNGGSNLFDMCMSTKEFVCTFALREYLCFIIESSPRTLESMKAMFKYDKFSEVVRETMGLLRQRVTQTISCIDVKSHPQRYAKAFILFCASPQIRRLCKTKHPEASAAGYQRQRPGLLSILHTCKRNRKGKFSIVAVDHTNHLIDGTPNTFSRHESVPMDKVYLIQRWFSLLDPLHHTLERDVWPHLVNMGVPQDAVDEMLLMVEDYNEQRMGKRSLIKRQSAFAAAYPQSFYLMQTLCAMWLDRDYPRIYWLPSHYREFQMDAIHERFGLPKHAPLPDGRLQLHQCKVCSHIYSIMMEWKDSRHNRNSREAMDAQLKMAAAVARNSTPKQQQVDGDADGDEDDQELVMDMIMESLDQNGTGVARGGSSHMRTMQSIALTSSANTKRGGRSRQPMNEYGYAGPRCDLQWKLRCGKDRSNGFQLCRTDPLDGHAILGRVVELKNGRCVTLCPQWGCGTAMVIDWHRTVFTERGMACSLCTLRIRAERLHRTLVSEFQMDADRSYKCAKCFSQCQKSKSFIYPHGVILCSLHNTPRLAADIKRAYRAGELQTAEACVAEITSLFKRYKKESSERNKAHTNYMLSKSRVATRQRRSWAVHVRC